MTSNILVTGGAGFIGSCFVAQSVARGDNVIVLDKLTYAGHPANLEWIPSSFPPPGRGRTKEGVLSPIAQSADSEPPPNLPLSGGRSGHWQLIKGDIADSALVEKLLREHRITHVVNFAAESHVDNSISGPKPFIDTNVTGTFLLLEACREYWQSLLAPEKKSFRFVQISTDEVYGSLGPTGKFSETSPIKPNSPYSASKAAADHLARAWFETYGFPAIVTHCTNNYGPRQHPEKLIPRIIHCALAGEKLPVYGDGKNIRDWIAVEDHCQGVHLALIKGKPGEVYDFGGDAEVENITLVKTLCALLDRKKPKSGNYAQQIAFVTDRLGHDRRYAIDDSKAIAQLGFARRYTLEQGLELAVDWYLANQEWCKKIAPHKPA